MNSYEEYNFFNYKDNDNTTNKYSIKNSLFTDSDNEEFFKKNYDTEKVISKNRNKCVPISNTIKPKNKDIYDMEKINSNFYHLNYNNHDNTIPINRKSKKPEIQNIDRILKCLKDDNSNYAIDIQMSNNSSSIGSIEELENKKEILIKKLKKIKEKNKELMAYLEPYKQSMSNEDIENEQIMKYIKYLDDKRKKNIYINNKLKQKSMNNQNISMKKKIEYLINKQIKHYEELLNSDSITNENLEIKNKNVYTHNNVEAKCELSLGNSNSEYKLNNATTDGLINSKHKTTVNDNLNNINNNTNTNKNKLNKNNSLIFGGEDKNKNNNSLKFKKNNSKSNFLSSIKYIQNRNSNTSSSITSSNNNNNNVNNNNNKTNKKSDFKNLKQNSKRSNGLKFKMK